MLSTLIGNIQFYYFFKLKNIIGWQKSKRLTNVVTKTGEQMGLGSVFLESKVILQNYWLILTQNVSWATIHSCPLITFVTSPSKNLGKNQGHYMDLRINEPAYDRF